LTDFRLAGVYLAVVMTLTPAANAADATEDQGRKRIRDLGIAIGSLNPGPLNAITDVEGVRVGHVTLNRGEGKLQPGKGPVRTGVTAILPHGGDLWNDKVAAATFVLNGTGEMTGSIWIETQGALEVPILLTNTMNVGRVMDGVVAYMMKHYPDIGIGDDVVVPTVAECDDSTLNDARGIHVSIEDTVRAIESAKGGPVAEGAVGAGMGMMAFDFKGGIGTSSRILAEDDGGYTVGVLVNANMDDRKNLRVDGVPVGREIGRTDRSSLRSPRTRLSITSNSSASPPRRRSALHALGRYPATAAEISSSRFQPRIGCPTSRRSAPTRCLWLPTPTSIRSFKPLRKRPRRRSSTP